MHPRGDGRRSQLRLKKKVEGLFASKVESSRRLFGLQLTFNTKIHKYTFAQVHKYTNTKIHEKEGLVSSKVESPCMLFGLQLTLVKCRQLEKTFYLDSGFLIETPHESTSKPAP